LAQLKPALVNADRVACGAGRSSTTILRRYRGIGLQTRAGCSRYQREVARGSLLGGTGRRRQKALAILSSLPRVQDRENLPTRESHGIGVSNRCCECPIDALGAHLACHTFGARRETASMPKRPPRTGRGVHRLCQALRLVSPPRRMRDVG
jgi:hypothetical protein